MADNESDVVRLHVSGLDKNFQKELLEKAFGEFGQINHVWIARRPPGFGFVDIIGRENAETALAKLNDTEVGDCRIRIEYARNNGRGERSERGERGERRRSSSRERGRGGDRDRERNTETKCYNCNGYGHYARDCQLPANRGECYLCHRRGHQQRDCPEARGGSRRYSPVRRSRERERDHYRGSYRSRSRSPYASRRYSPVRRSRSPPGGRYRSRSPVYDRRSSNQRSPSPRRRPSPPRRPASPRRRSPSPRHRSVSPRRHDSPPRRSASPRGDIDDKYVHRAEDVPPAL